jgi:hypothetical protein
MQKGHAKELKLRYDKTEVKRKGLSFDPYTYQGKDLDTLINGFNKLDTKEINVVYVYFEDDSPMGLYLQTYLKKDISKRLSLGQSTGIYCGSKWLVPKGFNKRGSAKECLEKEIAMGLLTFVRRALQLSKYPGELRVSHGDEGLVGYSFTPPRMFMEVYTTIKPVSLKPYCMLCMDIIRNAPIDFGVAPIIQTSRYESQPRQKFELHKKVTPKLREGFRRRSSRRRSSRRRSSRRR